MNLLPSMPLNDRPTAVSGNVTVHPTAKIATGVLLHADPGSHLIVGAGACIGWGCILHAHQGTLVIGEGAILGMGTLVVGNSQVGDYACIGSATSILDSAVLPQAVVPPNSFISRTSKTTGLAPPAPASPASIPTVPPIATETDEAELVSPETSPERAAPVAIPEIPKTPVNLSINAPIYGKKSLERLLATLRNEKPDLE